MPPRCGVHVMSQSPKAHALGYNYFAAIGGNFRIRKRRMRHPLIPSMHLPDSHKLTEHGLSLIHILFRERALGANAIQEIFSNINTQIENAHIQDKSADWIDEYAPFIGEVYMGHLRYSTTGRSGISYVHPFLRRNNWCSRTLMLCGNFNMTNVDEIFNAVVEKGQHPRIYSDTVIILEQLGYALDKENSRLYHEFTEKGIDGIGRAKAIAVSYTHLVEAVEWEKDENTGKMSLKHTGEVETIPAQLVLLAMGFTNPQAEGLLDQLGVEKDEMCIRDRPYIVITDC